MTLGNKIVGNILGGKKLRTDRYSRNMPYVIKYKTTGSNKWKHLLDSSTDEPDLMNRRNAEIELREQKETEPETTFRMYKIKGRGINKS